MSDHKDSVSSSRPRSTASSKVNIATGAKKAKINATKTVFENKAVNRPQEDSIVESFLGFISGLWNRTSSETTSSATADVNIGEDAEDMNLTLTEAEFKGGADNSPQRDPSSRVLSYVVLGILIAVAAPVVAPIVYRWWTNSIANKLEQLQ